MKGIMNKLAKFYSFFYFTFWGFFFSAGYLFCKKIIRFKVSFWYRFVYFGWWIYSDYYKRTPKGSLFLYKKWFELVKRII